MNFILRLSAVSKSRPVYRAVLELLSAGDVLVVWDLDRAYRSAADALGEVNALHRRGVSFHVANFPLDTSTAEGYLMLTVLVGLAEFERRILSRRTREGLAAARRRGKVLGRPRKLSSEQVAEARLKLQSERSTLSSVAAQYNVGRWTLSRALKSS